MKQILLILCTSITFAQTSFHQLNSSDDQLKYELHTKIKKNKKINYKDAKRHLFGALHLKKNAQDQWFVKDVYCNKIYDKNVKNIGPIGPKKIPNHTIVNCEHTWPQSKFSRNFDSRLQKGDLHHLFPTNSKANSVRSSNDFGDVRNGKSPTSNCSYSQSDGHFYEPPHEHKGNVARAMFYFSVRYRIAINSKMETTLKSWHHLDPVDQQERERNSAIEEIQRNRNPFIDNPELVEKISDF